MTQALVWAAFLLTIGTTDAALRIPGHSLEAAAIRLAVRLRAFPRWKGAESDAPSRSRSELGPRASEPTAAPVSRAYLRIRLTGGRFIDAGSDALGRDSVSVFPPDATDAMRADARRVAGIVLCCHSQ